MTLVLAFSSVSTFASEIEYGAITEPMTIVLTKKDPVSNGIYVDAENVMRLSFQKHLDKKGEVVGTYMLFNQFQENISYVQINKEVYKRLNYYLSFTHETCPTTLTINSLLIVKIENHCAQNR